MTKKLKCSWQDRGSQRCHRDTRNSIITLLLAIGWLAAASLCPIQAQPPFGVSVKNGDDAGSVKGADLSLLSFIEENGVQYREAGQPKSALMIFKDHGCNYVRLRLFVHPDGTEGQVNTLEYTLSLAKRIKQAGLRLLLDFHYSDGWADPGHQNIPGEWKELSHEALVKQVFDYTKDTLAAFQRADCLPDMVEVGNEITNGMMWPAGGPLKTPADFDAFAYLLKAGVRAVREFGSSEIIKVMIHVDKGGNSGVSKWFFDNCQQRQVNFDVIGLSYYPFWNGSLDDLRNNLSFLAATYQKDIVVAETGFNARGNAPRSAAFAYTPEGQKVYLESLLRIIAATPGGHGKGFFYWAPEWIMSQRWHGPKWSSQWEDRALFDSNGNVLPAIGVYGLKPMLAK